MSFVIRFRLIRFMADEERFPCTFGYKVGDEFIYDGERFHGRVCPGLLVGVTPVLYAMRYGGNRWAERLVWRYNGLKLRDPSMKQYDGCGFRPIKEPPEGVDPKYIDPEAGGTLPTTSGPQERQGGWTLTCPDSRASALFKVEPIALAQYGWDTPVYRRQMNILEKLKAEPGLTTDEILDRFTKWEREEIFPPLHRVNVPIMLEELEEVGYVEVRDGKAYPKNPPE